MHWHWHQVRKRKQKKKRSTILLILYLDSSVFLVPYPPIFILTVRNNKACHPLFGIISALRDHFNDLPRLLKIKLEVLATIVLPG